MTVSRITAEFDQCIKEVWGVVTSIENYWWRSDLDNVDIMIKSPKVLNHCFDTTNCSVAFSNSRNSTTLAIR